MTWGKVYRGKKRKYGKEVYRNVRWTYRDFKFKKRKKASYFNWNK